VYADVVEDRRVLEPLALAIRQAVNRARLIEQHDREPRDVLRMLRKVVAALGELEDAAPPDVGIPIGLRDLLAMARDVVEHEPFTQREIAQRDFFGAEPPQNLVEQNRAGNREVGAPRLE